MSTLGYSAGFGSIWRFPYLSKYKIKVYTHGGGAFLIPYLICFLTISIPLFYFETSLG
jgi:SNF family Na+-dependent transporter